MLFCLLVMIYTVKLSDTAIVMYVAYRILKYRNVKAGVQGFKYAASTDARCRSQKALLCMTAINSIYIVLISFDF